MLDNKRAPAEKLIKGGQIENENDKFAHRCALEHAEHFKREAFKARRACNKLVLTALVSFVFCLAEAVGGTISGSLAILCDAAHQLSDVTGFVISFLAIYLTRKQATLKYSYGYHRADVIGALGSILIIWGLLVWLLVEAAHRVLHPQEIDGTLMLITAIFGLFCNLTNLFVLQCCCNEEEEPERKQSVIELSSELKPPGLNYNLAKTKDSKGYDFEDAPVGAGDEIAEDPLPAVSEVKKAREDDEENLNVRAAIVHMLGDMIQSIGVIIAAIIIYVKPEWTIADPICTFVFSIVVMFVTIPVFNDCMRFLMETSPENIKVVDVYNSI